MRRLLPVILTAVFTVTGQQATLPVEQIRPDMEGVGRTVFRGQIAEEFPLRILGVLRNSGPGQDIILARLLTDRLQQTGVMQGMSGSPVYVEGKLIGAIAFAFPFAKDPIAGIRPIGEMLAVQQGRNPLRAAALHLGSQQIQPEVQTPAENAPTQVMTPVSFGGLTDRAIQYFASQWRQMGFVLQQGATGNRPTENGASLSAGDMVSVQLLRGDMSAGADGTVTHVDGKQVYAFGHRFLGGGEIEFPFAKAEVITPLANLNMPFKISQALGQMGTMLFDGDAAIRGEIGRQPRLTPLRIRYQDGATRREYKIEMVRHSLLSPLLLQMAIFSTLDHHFRSAGPGTVEMKGEVKYPGITKPLEITGRYSGDNNLPIAASLGAAIPVAFLQQHVEDTLLPESINFDLVATTASEKWVIEAASASRRTVKPGEALKFRVLLSTPNGKEKVIEHPFTVPAWLPAGETLTVTVSDAFTTNLLDFRSFYQPGGPVFRSTEALIETLGTLHPSNAVYLRVFRSSAAYQTAGKELSNLPPSINAVLQKTPGSYLPTYQSKILDRETLLPDGVVSGSRTLTLEIEK